MKCISNISTSIDSDQVVQELLKDCDGKYELACFFASRYDRNAVIDIATKIRKQVEIKNFIGCSCSGIIWTEEEFEEGSGCSLMLMQMNDVECLPFMMDQSTLRSLSKAEDWYSQLDVYPNEEPSFIVLGDPFLFDTGFFLNGINKSYPGQPVVGALASGANEERQNCHILNDQVFDEGLIGLSLKGDILINTVVSQGCRPFGENFIVTKAEENVIFELAGKSFYEVLETTMANATEDERKLAEEALFVGIAMDEYKHKMHRGDFLIRMLVGIDEQSGAGAIADYIEQGQTIQFHVRDANSATKDLTSLVKHYKKTQTNLSNVCGALIFNCSGRGKDLFNQSNHDIDIVKNMLGDFPLGGFFSAGEIGPVGGKNFVHGFTSSIAFFSPKTKT